MCACCRKGTVELTFMNDIVEYLRDFNYVTVAVRLLLAFVLGGIIGTDRERKGRPAGMRTHILVCMGAAITTMTGFFVVDAIDYSADPLRVSAQVVSGIGFLGVGTILVTGRMHVKGLTTAAGLWTTASIGISLGAGFYEGAILCTLLAVIAVSALQRLEGLMGGKYQVVEIYIELKNADATNSVARLISSEEYGVYKIQITPSRSGLPNNIGIEGLLRVAKGQDKAAALDRISAIPEVAFAVESV